MRTYLLIFLLSASTAALAQTPQSKAVPRNSTKPGATAAPTQAAPEPAEPTGVDAIIELVKGNMPEALVLKTIQSEGKAYNLTPTDLLKLQKAGVSEKIIETMMDPTAASAPAPTPTPAAAEVAPAAAPAVAAAPARATAEAAPAPAAPAAAPKPAPKKGGGLFSSMKDKLSNTAKKTVDGIGDTADSAVSTTVDGVQNKADTAVGDAVGAPAKKASGATQGATAGATTGTAASAAPASTQVAAQGKRTATK